MKKISLYTLCFCILLCGCVGNKSHTNERPYEDRARVNEEIYLSALSAVRENYFDESLGNAYFESLRSKFLQEAISANSIKELYAVINKMLSELHTSHLFASSQGAPVNNPNSVATYGFEYRERDNKILVSTIPINSPAYIAGVRYGWTVLSQNNKDISFANQVDSIAALGGKADFAFLDRSGEHHSISIVPGVMPVDSFSMESRSLDGNILYLHFSAFSYSHIRWMSRKLKENSNADGVIIDLRGNRGGYQNYTLMALGEFFPSSVEAGYNTFRNGVNSKLASRSFFSAKFPGRVAILTDSFTASAAEIFTHVMQYHGRATVIGSKTSGLVRTRRNFELPYKGEIIIPVAEYIGLDGKPLEGVGVVPDMEVVVPSPNSYLADKDVELEDALKVISGN